jgi:nucleoside-diphosphate-sugar epimerase
VLDALDARAVREAVAAAAPDAIIHQATALANVRFSKNLDRSLAETNRLRREGTDALLAAAREAGVTRSVAQSYASSEIPAQPASPAELSLSDVCRLDLNENHV